MTSKPTVKPNNPCFSSGPCAKRPGWSVEALKDAFLGRSHRAAEGKKRINDVVERQRKILNIPADYKMAIVPASAERLRMRGVAFRTLQPPVRAPHLADVRFGLAWARKKASATTMQFVEMVTAALPAMGMRDGHDA